MKTGLITRAVAVVVFVASTATASLVAQTQSVRLEEAIDMDALTAGHGTGVRAGEQREFGQASGHWRLATQPVGQLGL